MSEDSTPPPNKTSDIQSGTPNPSTQSGATGDSEPPKKNKVDLSSLHDEGRVDIRTYGQLEIQVVTLLLTTMFVLIGWLASTYASDTYKTAVRVMAPGLVAAPNASDPLFIVGIREKADNTPTIIKKTHKALDDVTKLYRDMLLRSPITSLILAGCCFFATVVAGMLTILTFQIQRRRYTCHKLAHDQREHTDEAVADPVLIIRALNLFILIVILTAFLIYGLLLYQLRQCLRWDTALWLQATLIFVALVLSVKVAHTAHMFYNFFNIERNEGYKYYSLHGIALIDRIVDNLKLKPTVEKPPVQEAIDDYDESEKVEVDTDRRSALPSDGYKALAELRSVLQEPKRPPRRKIRRAFKNVQKALEPVIGGKSLWVHGDLRVLSDIIGAVTPRYMIIMIDIVVTAVVLMFLLRTK